MNKEQLVEIVNEFKSKVEDLSKKACEQITDELQEVLKKIDEIEAGSVSEESKYWTPKVGDRYFYLSSDGEVFSCTYEDYLSDIKSLEILNAFQTEEEAEREQFEILLKRRLKKFAIENNEEEIDWNNHDQDKYYIYYDNYDNEFEWAYVDSNKDYGQVYFSSAEIVKRAIEEFHDDLIRYFTSDK